MTSAKEQLIEELNQAPDFVVQEVLNFLLFIKLRLKYKIIEPQINPSEQSSSLPPFLQFAETVSAQIPRAEWEKLPKDFSKQVDHYLYGTPKDNE